MEAVRRTIALAIQNMCPAIEAAVSGDGKPTPGLSITESAVVLRQARDFLSDVSGPPDSDSEELRLTGALHALDHISRLAEIAGEAPESPTAKDGPDETRGGAPLTRKISLPSAARCRVAMNLCSDSKGMASMRGKASSSACRSMPSLVAKG